ncbi:MAG: hypothetical protein ABFD04_11645 [Syntrophomonas sp.]
MKKIKGFKGFNQDLKCRDFQYEIGKDYEEERAEACCTGFHFCENPMDVFGYYPPAANRFCKVEGSGQVDRNGDDSKVACSKIHIGAEIGLPGLIQAGVNFILERINWDDSKESNTGNRSAATNTGYQSAATNTGYQSAATNTGNRSAATNTGDQSAATNTGYQSAASVEGQESVAMAIGYESKAKGALGCWIVLSEWGHDGEGRWHIVDVQSTKVDDEQIKADTWYQLKNGVFVEAEAEGD